MIDIQVKLSIVQLVGAGAVDAESVASLLVVAAADSRHRSALSVIVAVFVIDNTYANTLIKCMSLYVRILIMNCSHPFRTLRDFNFC